MDVGVADSLAIMEISTAVVTDVDMLRLSFDDSSSDVSESALVCRSKLITVRLWCHYRCHYR